MRRVVAAALMAAQFAVAAHAQEAVPVVPENWARASVPDPALIRRVVKESIEEEKALDVARSKAAAIPVRFTASSQPDMDKYEKFEVMFDDAKVPGCMSPQALKRQPTFFLGGILALPFVAVAAIRGKCN